MPASPVTGLAGDGGGGELRTDSPEAVRPLAQAIAQRAAHQQKIQRKADAGPDADDRRQQGHRTENVNGKLKTIEQIQLDYPIAYGASVSVKEENAIYYLGGSPDSEHMRDVLKVTLKNGKLKTEIYAKLPLGFENGVAPQ